MRYKEFCKARGLVEEHLRQGLVTVEELFKRCEWDHSAYDEEDWTINNLQKHFCLADEYLEDLLEDDIGATKAWFCRGCPAAFFGDKCLKKRRRHQKTCRYLPIFFTFKANNFGNFHREENFEKEELLKFSSQEVKRSVEEISKTLSPQIQTTNISLM